MGLISKSFWLLFLATALFGGVYVIDSGIIEIDQSITDNITDNVTNNRSINDKLDDIKTDGNTVDKTVNSTPVNRSYLYEIDSGTAKVTTRKRVDTEQGYNTFNQNFRLPSSDAEVISVNDTNQELEYTKDGAIVEFSSQTDERRTAELFTVVYETNVTVETPSEKTQTYDISATSSKNESLSVKVVTDNILSVYMQSEHSYDIKGNDIVVVRGKGPARFSVITGNPQYQRSDIAVFNESDTTVFEQVSKNEFENDYRLTRSIVGNTRDDVTHPIVVLNNTKFEDEFGSQIGVAGTYTRGITYLPEKTLKGNSPNAVIAHELTHSMNGQIGPYLPAWFDEGTATFVETVTAKRYGELYVKPFATEQYYPKGCKNDRTSDCRVVSSGTSPSELYNYISNNRTFMTERIWNPTTKFKYSYSSLMINIVESNGRLSNVYSRMYNQSMKYRDSDTSEDATSKVLNDIGRESLNPCEEFADSQNLEYPTQETIETCIDNFDNIPKYPESLNEEYSVYRRNLVHKEAQPP